ncbi:MAG: FecR domain-containing protein [Candidatus Omnitrophota bacterium]
MKYFKFATIIFLIFILIPTLAQARPEPFVKVISVSGSAEYLASGKTDWEELKVDMLLRSGDSVKTGKDSSVNIAFDGERENVVNIRSSTHVVLVLGEREKIELVDGEVFALIKRLPSGSSFEIRTPTAVCGARGTGWGALVDRLKTIISSYENASYAKGIKKDGTLTDETIILEGYKAIVKIYGEISKLMKIADKDYEQWNTWKDALIELLSRARAIMERLAKDLDKIQDQKEKIEERRDEDRIRKREEATGAGTGPTDRLKDSY